MRGSVSSPAGQHYLAAPYQMSAVFPLLSRLAAEAGEMRVAATVILVPLHNPVELAESIATLDCITDGRFVFGVGLGYRDEGVHRLRVERSQRVGRLNEAMELIKRLWSEDEVEFSGKYYTVPKTKISTKPVQNPHPPIWVAATMTPPSAAPPVGAALGSLIPMPLCRRSLTNGRGTKRPSRSSDNRSRKNCP